MVNEIVTQCPPLGRALEDGRFWPVPSSGVQSAFEAHARRLLQHGGVALQFLGLGRNGHIAFNEPGTDFDLEFHRATLADSTRDAARSRFALADLPTEAVTAGPASILAAKRIVLAVTGAAKAPALQRMLDGPIDPACPASVLRRHEAVTVLLDEAAAGELP